MNLFLFLPFIQMYLFQEVLSFDPNFVTNAIKNTDFEWKNLKDEFSKGKMVNLLIFL